MNGENILKSSEKFKIKLGLERVQKILKILNNPEKDIKFIHVAGTNGKGSTCAIIEAVLLEWGKYKIGKFTSPHLFKYNERFSVNGINISDDELDELILYVNKIDNENDIGLSEFEILTVVCFLFFKRHNVQIGILETGLGGRLDSTNVIENPLISIITSISFDHKERLGDTIELISKEKAGIFKKNSKCTFLKENLGYKTLLKEAEEKEAIFVKKNIEVLTEKGYATINGEKTPFSLYGDFQSENLKLALIAISEVFPNITFDTIKKAISKVKWKFRMEELSLYNKNILIDSSHNPDGARVLKEYLTKYHKNKKIKFIFGCLKNKEYEKIIKTLYNPSYDFYFYEFNYPNALKYEYVKDFNFKKTTSPINEIKKGDFDLCVISGSIYMLGEIFKGIN